MYFESEKFRNALTRFFKEENELMVKIGLIQDEYPIEKVNNMINRIIKVNEYLNGIYHRYKKTDNWAFPQCEIMNRFDDILKFTNFGTEELPEFNITKIKMYLWIEDSVYEQDKEKEYKLAKELFDSITDDILNDDCNEPRNIDIPDGLYDLFTDVTDSIFEKLSTEDKSKKKYNVEPYKNKENNDKNKIVDFPQRNND